MSGLCGGGDVIPPCILVGRDGIGGGASVVSSSIDYWKAMTEYTVKR